jgi:uncharacterized protein YcfJ
MKIVNSMIAIVLLVFVSAASADHKNSHKNKHGQIANSRHFEYAKVIDVEPLYREVRVSSPVRECWDEPVYHTESRQSKSAGGMVAGGLIGGIIGHQFGNGRSNKIATAMGTLIGAQIGHDASNGHAKRSTRTVVDYRETCRVNHKVSYEEVIDGYQVTYKFRGNRYQIEMPYHPGKRLKMRVEFSPEI